jgi:hypothetical protein
MTASCDYDAKLAEFFPPDDPHTSWLFRLMVIRDDLAFETENLMWVEDEKHGDRKEDRATWKTSYFIRRLSVSLLEAWNIFTHDVTSFIKQLDDNDGKMIAHPLRQAIKDIERVKPTLKNMRDVLGGHVRPKDDAVPTVIRSWSATAGRITISRDPQAISYCGLTKEVIPFAWPDVADETALVARHQEFHAALMIATQETSSVIDIVLQYKWKKLGLVRRSDFYPS